MELDELIQEVLRKALHKLDTGSDAGAAAEGTVYREEPILQRASQMSFSLPARYRQMRLLAREPQARLHSAAWLFCQQGAFMADFEEDFEYRGSFTHFYPTYQVMTAQQLRGYFSWRTRVRRGQVEQAPLAFAFVYVYELLNQIGVASPEDGFARLQTFWTAYHPLDAHLDPYLKKWLRDYVVYYGLDRALLSDAANAADAAYESALQALRQPEAQTPEALFEALAALSTYHLETGRLYRQQPQRVRRVACGVFLRLSQYYHKHRKSTLFERLFGRTVTGPYQMFDSAVFWDQRRYPDYTYELGPLHRYRCQAGIWSCERLLRQPGRCSELGSILKTVDQRMRERLGVRPPIQPGKTTRILLELIDREIDALLAEEARAAVPQLTLDLSLLEGIRQAADATRDKLIVEEKGSCPPTVLRAAAAADSSTMPGTTEPMPVGRAPAKAAEDAPGPASHAGPGLPPPDGRAVPTAADAPAAEQPERVLEQTVPPDTGRMSAPTADLSSLFPAAAAAAPDGLSSLAATDASTTANRAATLPAGLSAAECGLLHDLLWGSHTPLPPGQLASVLVDGINDKLFEHFGDTVIVYDGDDTVLLEDYMDELKGMIPL